ncbi:hypothetical protein [Kribbella deserti]|uniref:Uncharacterized protein n=1 Tax=Kribbella deserti TaxID=1926257 RepID=A0ABV6QVP9_9ACTN
MTTYKAFALKAAVAASVLALTGVGVISPAAATSQAKSYTIPGSQGTITSNTWRTTGNGSISGNTRQWDYQVSAVYSGSKTVQRIRTTWWSGASLRTSASISVSVGGSEVSVSAGSDWQHATTNPKYWENTNGSKTSSWRSNIVVAPQQYYLSGTIFMANTALVKLSSDTRTFQITASA